MVFQTATIVDAGIRAVRAPKKREPGAKKPINAGVLIETMYEKSVPALFKDLQSEDWRTRAYAVHALGWKKTRAPWTGRVAGALARAIREDGDWWVKTLSIEALAKMDDKRVVPTLISALRDKNNYVVITASDALGKMCDSATAAALKRAISRSDDPAHKALLSKVLAEVFAHRKAE